MSYNYPQQDKCTHIEQQPQHFQRRSDMRRVRALVQPFGDGAFEREMGNITGRNWIDNVFEKDWIDCVADGANDFNSGDGCREFSHVFTGYDPAGEGFSKNAIVSVVFDKNNKPFGAPYNCIVRSSLFYYLYTYIQPILPGWRRRERG